MQGTEDEIMARLWELSLADMDSILVATAVRQLQQGYRVIELCGERYEIQDPEWTVEQDVYGCEKGRACTSATATDRVWFEALIAARSSAVD